jgi:hypothetical protein
MSKFIVPIILVASTFAVTGFAQDKPTVSVTSVQVKAEVVQLSQAAYLPASEHTTYRHKATGCRSSTSPISSNWCDRSWWF